MKEPSTNELIQLALSRQKAGDHAQAEIIYRQILAREPTNPDASHLFGVLAMQTGNLDAAIYLITQAIRNSPPDPVHYANLSKALRNIGRLEEAINASRKAIELQPDYAEAHNKLGMALKDFGYLDEAISSFQRAIALKPDRAGVHNNLGYALSERGRLDDAVASLRQAIALKPDLAEAHNNLGNALKDLGQIDDAITAYRNAVQLQPAHVVAHNNLLYALHFHPGYDAAMILREHQHWNQQHAQPLAKFIQPHTNNRDSHRQLRIGYVSPDFREHTVGRFLLPLLENHNPDQFAAYCYSDVRRSDRFTELHRRHASQWRNIGGQSDEAVARLIRDDQIDILIDLTMHAANNRLLVFARKPAPVQITYLSYPSTTGLNTIDYRLTDPYLDPPGMNDVLYTEKTIRLPDTYWCYPPHHDAPAIAPFPSKETGQVTFGCLNNFSKLSPETLDLWAQLLRAIPTARLLLHAHEGGHRARLCKFLNDRQVDPKRIAFVAMAPLPQYFAFYQQIDICLDPFPYNGGTTTCDALWMGVPVITLPGKTPVARAGLSILSNVGLHDLIAQTPHDYIQIAIALVKDESHRTTLRQTLRQTMSTSPLMNASRFTQTIEAAYRQTWQQWCQVTSSHRTSER